MGAQVVSWSSPAIDVSAPRPVKTIRPATMSEEDQSKKAEKKVFDEADEAFCGYVSLQALDQDGISGRTIGSSVTAPVHIVSAPGDDVVLMEAHFLATNPLFFLELRNEEQFYLWGQWWMDGPSHAANKEICTLVPIRMQECHKQQEKTPNEFKAAAMCDFLRNSTSRLLDVQLTTVEKKFKTKLTKVTLAMPREAWMEYKAYRVRLWKASKAMQGQEKEDKKDEKKDEEKKDG